MELYQLSYNYVRCGEKPIVNDNNKDEFNKNRRELLRMTTYVYGGIFFFILLFWLFQTIVDIVEKTVKTVVPMFRPIWYNSRITCGPGPVNLIVYRLKTMDHGTRTILTVMVDGCNG